MKLFDNSVCLRRSFVNATVNGRELLYDYGDDVNPTDDDNDSGINDLMSRATHIYEVVTNASSTDTNRLATYSRTGGGRVVRVKRADYYSYQLTGQQTPTVIPEGQGLTAKYGLAHGTGDAYDGLDRFGRVKDLRWTNGAGTTNHVQLKYGHDMAGELPGRRPDTIFVRKRRSPSMVLPSTPCRILDFAVLLEAVSPSLTVPAVSL